MDVVAVDIWSDIACPWCYVGKRHLEAALADFPERERVTLRYRAFELDPSAPAEFPPEPSYAQRLATKYSVSLQQGEAMIERMTRAGAALDIDFRFDRIQAGNTFDAHRLLHLALRHGLQAEYKEQLLRAYFSDGKPIGAQATLLSCAEQVGLDVDAASAVLQSDEFARDVREEQAAAGALGISGVPFFVIGRRRGAEDPANEKSWGVSGAQPAALLLRVLKQALETKAPHLDELAEGAACGPDGC